MVAKLKLPIIFLATLIVFVLADVYFSRPKEPVYEGKTLTEWLAEWDDATTSPSTTHNSEKALKAISAIGTNAIPTLLKYMQAKDLPGVERLESHVQALGWEGFHITSTRRNHILARLGLILLGKAARPATPALIELLKSQPRDSPSDIPIILTYIEPPKEMALAELISLLNNTRGDLHYQIASCLAELYPDEAAKAGVYDKFPNLKLIKTNAPASNS